MLRRLADRRQRRRASAQLRASRAVTRSRPEDDFQAWLASRDFAAGHWLQQHAPAEVNAHLLRWLADVIQ